MEQNEQNGGHQSEADETREWEHTRTNVPDLREGYVEKQLRAGAVFAVAVAADAWK